MKKNGFHFYLSVSMSSARTCLAKVSTKTESFNLFIHIEITALPSYSTNADYDRYNVKHVV